MVLPDPVSPITIKILFSLIASSSSSLNVYIGRDSLHSFILMWVLFLTVDLNIASFFQSGISIYKLLLFPNVCASGSSLYLSLVNYSLFALYSYSLISLRSLANYYAFNASLYSVPSGFLTTLIGDKLIPALVVWPLKNGGS